MPKPTYASVTETLCACEYLQRSAEDPETPIVFDETTNEFAFEWTSEGINHSFVIYHCPFCGGVAPESKRHTLFAAISSNEARRLHELFAGVKTLEDAVSEFGPPDQDFPVGTSVSTPEGEGVPPTIRIYHTMIFEQFSETADVHLTYSQRDGVAVTLQGKYIGKPVQKS